jgi:hypothetical protein
LGEHELKGLPEPVRIVSLIAAAEPQCSHLQPRKYAVTQFTSRYLCKLSATHSFDIGVEALRDRHQRRRQHGRIDWI